MRRAITLASLIGFLALAFSVVGMNRYRFEKAGNRIVRANRFTGQVCFLQSDGTWNSSWSGTPRWVDAYMHGESKIVRVPPGKEVTFDPSEIDTKPLPVSQPDMIDKALEAIETEPGKYMTIKAVEVEAAKYSLNTCH